MSLTNLCMPISLYIFFISQIEKMNMQELKLQEGRLYSGMGIVFLVFLLCLGLLVCFSHLPCYLEFVNHD